MVPIGTFSWNRILSALVAIGYLFVALLARGGGGVCRMALFLILPMFCIWFSDAMGGYRGMTSQLIFISPSPGIMVRVLGWILLLLPIVFSVMEYGGFF
jgi:hypothetical protein